jgi:hypothetical protein
MTNQQSQDNSRPDNSRMNEPVGNRPSHGPIDTPSTTDPDPTEGPGELIANQDEIASRRRAS